MTKFTTLRILTFLFALVIVGIWTENASAQYRQRVAPDLFYNYYVAPNPGGIGAELYPAPRPTPPWVGHTFITYEPLMPHEFLYQHKRVYWRWHPDAGWTKTWVCWR